VNPPGAAEVTDRALVIYAFARRASIEYALGEFGHEPQRIAQAERARLETERWLERESLTGALSEVEQRLLDAPSGTWPNQAVTDGMWRRESLAVLLWALQRVETLPAFGQEADPASLDEAITSAGSVSSFRAYGRLRPTDEIERAWGEADAWFGATEGRGGEDAALASISAERLRALSWLRDRDAAPA
jgi:hypothetical protein